ncbi:LuxR family transcriptional regulator [Micromonospora sp. KC213]|uniref:ATP-binding protein n=1 Tax=Micromonospora sp. KC213 TaxID=2530378 RepID=UPI00104F531E|nr:LuxR family transcriptional regulator [Micromonospora sp. KC213]TDC41146.1 LuxR family transcriptional regulator [Micromonospora sp. KC213]
MTADASLLEREAELALLGRAFTTAAHGRGAAVLVEGPAGIGKSTLMEVARRAATATGLRVLSARGSQLEQEFGYGVVRQLVEPVLYTAPTAERVRLLRGPAHRVPALLDVDSTGPAAGDLAVSYALYWLLVNLTGRAPVALVVDDAHWVDDASLRFLRYLMPRAAELPLAIVVAGRPGADAGQWGELAAEPAVTLMRLAPLSPAGTARLVESVTATASAELVSACHRLTGGNPLLVRELATAARAAGGAAADGDEPALRALGGAALAQRMPAVLANLTPAAVRFAEACAVLGEEAAPQMVSGLTEGGERWDDLRGELVTAGILRTGSRVAFRHVLIRDAVYAGIDPVTRSRLHRRAAELLVADGQPVVLAATHLLATLPAADSWVVRTMLDAAGDAANRASPRSALAFLERALQEPPPDQRTTTNLIRLAGTVAQGVNWQTAISYLRRAASLAEDIVERAQVTELLGRATLLACRNAEAIALLERMLSELNGEHPDLDHRLRTVILAAAAADLDLRHTGAPHLAVLRAAPRLSADVRYRLDALTAFWAASIDVDRPTAVAAALRALRARAGGAPNPVTASPVLAYGTLVDADHEEALSELDRAWSAAHEKGSTHEAGLAAAFRAYALLSHGHLADAEEDTRTAMAFTSAPLATVSRAAYAGVIRADVLLARGQRDAAARAMRWASAQVQLVPAQQLKIALLQARLDLAEGRPEEAARRAEEAGRRLTGDGWLNPAIWPWRSVAALGRHALGQRDRARALAVDELDLARRWGAPRALSRALRIVATVTGDRAAEHLLEEAVRVVRPTPARLELATALHAFGAAIRLRHPKAARAALGEALQLARECGADELARQAREALTDLGEQVLAPAHARLTPAEWRVARLAAEGRANHEIAQDLHVTPKTVETHLSSVYRKLGVRNRTAMARVLAETNVGQAG